MGRSNLALIGFIGFKSCNLALIPYVMTKLVINTLNHRDNSMDIKTITHNHKTNNHWFHMIIYCTRYKNDEGHTWEWRPWLTCNSMSVELLPSKFDFAYHNNHNNNVGDDSLPNQLLSLCNWEPPNPQSTIYPNCKFFLSENSSKPKNQRYLLPFSSSIKYNSLVHPCIGSTCHHANLPFLILTWLILSYLFSYLNLIESSITYLILFIYIYLLYILELFIIINPYYYLYFTIITINTGCYKQDI